MYEIKYFVHKDVTYQYRGQPKMIKLHNSDQKVRGEAISICMGKGGGGAEVFILTLMRMAKDLSVLVLFEGL
jgi:hypothetical protein